VPGWQDIHLLDVGGPSRSEAITMPRAVRPPDLSHDDQAGRLVQGERHVQQMTEQASIANA
jgi:hypothetical protein